ncbi:hypothetical protein HY501_03090 [Candidatus Woesearchaeota archaeon]|nr:hypothetical protein [Candidatus Woesearchaeota archaeon]
MQAKKGDLSINFIIVAALALIVLIAIALFFTGGIQKLFGTQKGAVGVTVDPQVRALAVQNCKLHCSLGNQDAYNNPNFPAELKSEASTCAVLLEKMNEAGPFDFESRCGPKCTGTSSEVPKPCDAQKSEEACESVSGCNWG